MAEIRPPVQPGPIFYEVFTGALRIFGTNLKDWSATQGVDPNNAKMAATGSWNGPKARILRAAMVDLVGEETFNRLYQERLRREAKAA
jgi:hypothetical protein